ncbi:ring-cleaving dioxygenase [Halalkalibacterium halodurans]|uniref:BH2175 protein n=1 Tax=Halalkalibacterium halodurans (strain ATCC BAA-125 / DSM 18197 / FERM 7344 / JCM 9153 / C-125) TaxID=272558 RepID=Q9KAW1_HALH5|nr:ring-cleaving dioxygenase [Halalkalibacterium halodurans]MED4173663.1 ring-cleaving dioxygenase [Halalkalibacterium halodurans]BAB05894.1 BH2175 [Halalkalibacterium halodurans C-125]
MQLKPLKGQHHVSAITAKAKENYTFYTKTLGMRLVKKTVNQDDTSMYHLFYADERGNPGTDLTFFEIPHAGQTYQGTNSITKTSLRVPSDEALQYWLKRFDEFGIEHDGVSHHTGRATLAFRDFEGQRLELVSDENNEGVASGIPWKESPVPEAYAIRGLGPVTLTVSRPELTEKILIDVMGYREKGSYPSLVEGQPDVKVFETGEGGTGAEVHLETRKDIGRERPGRGSVHHVAFRVESKEELEKWVDYITNIGLPNSGFVERYYFRSLYFREPNGILFELATDGPGFEGDEPFETLGESLALPPYLEPQRETIEKNLKPLDTAQS